MCAVLDVKQNWRSPTRRSVLGLLRAGCDPLPLPWLKRQPVVVVPRGDEANRARQQRQVLIYQRGEEQASDGSVQRRQHAPEMDVGKLRREQTVTKYDFDACEFGDCVNFMFHFIYAQFIVHST